MKDKVLITGGAGFVGENLVKYLLKRSYKNLVIFDKLEKNKLENYGEEVVYFKGNICSENEIKKVFRDYGPFSVVFHLAAGQPNKSMSNSSLWETNVTGTVNLVKEAIRNKTNSFIFTSTNVTYGIPKNLPVTEKSPLLSIETYGKSKAAAEKELKKFQKEINIQIFRCPVISGLGRLGLQSILFEFISESRNVYVLGDGSNKYQFVDVIDVCKALEVSTRAKGYDIYNIGADEILTLHQLYQKLILFAKSRSRIISLPKTPAILILAFLERLNISPLGVYQYSMIGRSLYMDTTKIKKKFKWKPSKTNLDTFIENYQWYIRNKKSFERIDSGRFSDNKSLPKLGFFKLLKLIS